MSEMADGDPIVRVENLTKYYPTADGFLDKILGKTSWVKALDGVSFELHEGETLGIVGESGCGKSTLGRTLLQLEEPTEGTVHYDGTDLTQVSSSRMRAYRTDLQYIFQNPFASLNPRLTVGDIIGEPLDIHGIASGAEREERIYELLETVGLNPSHANRYPHEFSGGQRQRIGIARALAVDPELIVCDEPVSALDVSVQAQILNLLEDLQEEFGLSYIFIAHDLSVVEHIADRIGVMYLGEIAEMGTAEEVFAEPHHPYTEALLSAIPEPDPLWEGDRILLSGTVPSPIDPPSGCKFHTRCPRVIQPAEYDIEQDAWRSIVTLKTRLGDGSSVTPDQLVSASEDADTDLTKLNVSAAVRRAYDLPEELSDPNAERVLSETLERIEVDDVTGAAAVLSEAFTTPCEVHRPTLVGRDGAHPIACHLFDERYADGTVATAEDADDGETGAMADD